MNGIPLLPPSFFLNLSPNPLSRERGNIVVLKFSPFLSGGRGLGGWRLREEKRKQG